MINYILKRLFFVPVLLIVLSVLIFSLVMFISPSERLTVFMSNPESLADVPADQLISRYGLDKPFHIQYFKWFKKVCKGQLGWSPSARMPVAEALLLRIPATIELMLCGQVIIFFAGIILGTYAAINHNNFYDCLIRFLTVLGNSLPIFIFALLLLIIFYACWGLFPPGRLSTWAEDIVYSAEFINYTGLNMIDALINARFDVFLDALRHIILPSIAYSLGMLAATVRLMRSSLLENLAKDYVTTARGKGLSQKAVVNKHARRNALLPVITFIGMEIPEMFGGAVIVENIFNYPGMGSFIVTAAQGLDFPAVIGASLIIGIIIIICNLIVDVLYRILNPKISLE